MGIFDFAPISEVQKGVNNLTKIALRHGAEKTPRSGRSYTAFYYDLFADKNDKIKKVLQIGLGHKEQNSLYFWRDYFPTAKVYGIGNDKKYVFKSGRIQTFLGERTDSKGLKNIINEIGGDIDVVVDEGTRKPEEIVSSFQTIMPMLKKNAVYIVEGTDSPEAAKITASLSNYDFNVIRRSRMLSRRDRLIAITNKTA